MISKTLNVFLLIVAFSAYPSEFDSSVSVGIVNVNGSELQLSTFKNILPSDRVIVCTTVKKSCVAYNGSDFLSVASNASVEDVATGHSIYTYSLNKAKDHISQSEINLAFIFPKDKVKVSDVKFDGKHSFAIKNNKIQSAISYCTSSEGVHIISESGNIHLYYSLGYEVEANCSHEVYE